MQGYINQKGVYHQGDEQPGDIAVFSQPPAATGYFFDFITGSWLSNDHVWVPTTSTVVSIPPNGISTNLTVIGGSWVAATPLPDLAGLQTAIHQSTEFTVTMIVNLYANPNGSALFTLCQVATMLGDWSHVQTVYGNLKTTPPTGWTVANVTDLGNLAVAHHCNITP